MLNPDLDHLRQQRTLAEPLLFVGIGLHSGRHVNLRIRPAEANHGIRIVRRDLSRNEGSFAVTWDKVVSTELCTTLGNSCGHQVSTVEHLLSALHALCIDNALVELDGPEIPIMDGSAAPFVAALQHVGTQALAAPREVILVRRPVRLQLGESRAELLPDEAQRITVSIDFNHQDIGQQSLSCCLSPVAYAREIAPARTFGFAEHLWHLQRRGLARGGSIKNAILLESGRVANREGLRFHDEFVRHKALDAIGDLSLAGAPIVGHYRGHRPGHRLNIELLHLLMRDHSAWERIPVAELPGAFASRALPAPYPETGPDDKEAARGERPSISARLFRIFGQDSG